MHGIQLTRYTNSISLSLSLIEGLLKARQCFQKCVQGWHNNIVSF